MDPALAGVSIKSAWGGAKLNPRIVGVERKSPRSGRQPFITSQSQLFRYLRLRALIFSSFPNHSIGASLTLSDIKLN